MPQLPLHALAIDTCFGALGVAVSGPAGTISELSPMARGQVEALPGLVRDVMARADVRFTQLERIVCTIGPGSFTGIRIGLAFARGLGVALGVPVIGVSTLEAVALGDGDSGIRVGAFKAIGELVFVQAFVQGQAMPPARALPGAYLADHNLTGIDFAAGDAATAFASFARSAEAIHLCGSPDPSQLLAIGCRKDIVAAPPTPLYLRPPSAKLPGGIDPWAE